MSFYPFIINLTRAEYRLYMTPILTPLKQTALLLHGLHFVSLSREKFWHKIMLFVKFLKKNAEAGQAFF